MPRCMEPQTPRTPQETEFEPVLLPMLDSSIVGSRLKERLLSVVQEQYNALQHQLETQHDLLLHAIDQMLIISPDSGTFDKGTGENDLPRSPDDTQQLLVTPPSKRSIGMCDMARAEMVDSADHDIAASHIDETPTALRKLEAKVSKAAHTTVLQLQRSRVASRILNLDSKFDHLKERIKKDIDVGEGMFKRAGGGKFDGFIGIVILANSIVLAIQLQWQGWEAGVQLGFNPVEAYDAHDVVNTCYILEHVFNAIFLVELILRLSIFRYGFFADSANLFDLLLVLITTFELYIMHPLKTSLGGNISFLRVFRLAKLVRVLRIVRVLKLFKHLRILVQTITASAHALLWSIVLISVIVILGGIFMCQMLHAYVTDDTKEETTRKWAWTMYGTSTRSTYTMFEATLSGCWPNYVRPLVEDFSPWYAFVFIMYITGVNFAIIRIIAAIFLRETLTVASNDADMVVQQQRHTKKKYVEKLKAFFREADSSGDGLIDYEEFQTILQNPKVRTWLACLELEIHETQALFHLLDDGDGLVTYDEFLKGALRLKGHARSIDIIAIMHDMMRLQRKLETVQDLVIFSMPKTGRAQAEEYLKGKQIQRDNAEPHADELQL